MSYRIEVVYNILRLWLVNKTYPPLIKKEERFIPKIQSSEIKRPMGMKVGIISFLGYNECD